MKCELTLTIIPIFVIIAIAISIAIVIPIITKSGTGCFRSFVFFLK